MKSNSFLIISLLVLLVACKKEEAVVAVHQGLTRIDYAVNNPFEMPRMTFTLSQTYNLSNHDHLEISLLAGDEAGRLNLMIMLEDERGHKNDDQPIMLTEEDIIFDNELHRYSFDLNDHLGSATSSTDQIDLSRITTVIVYINAGITGKVSEGSFRLNSLEFIKSNLN